MGCTKAGTGACPSYVTLQGSSHTSVPTEIMDSLETQPHWAGFKPPTVGREDFNIIVGCELVQWEARAVCGTTWEVFRTISAARDPVLLLW
jgi:hypothetical protein